MQDGPQAPGSSEPDAAVPSAPDTQLVRLDFAATLEPNQVVAIDNPYGDVRLRFGGYEHAVEIHAVAQEPATAAPIGLQPVVEGTRYVIAPRLPAATLIVEGQRLDLVVFIPTGHSVSVRTERGLIESRGIRGDLDLQSNSGNLAIRGTLGSVVARTGPGSIEASLQTAPVGSRQHLSTTTGEIVLAVDDKLDARLEMATSAAFATEFSLDVEPRVGEEPNKRATTLIGKNNATVIVESRRGEIRLLRWSGFTSVDAKPSNEEEADSDSD